MREGRSSVCGFRVVGKKLAGRTLKPNPVSLGSSVYSFRFYDFRFWADGCCRAWARRLGPTWTLAVLPSLVSVLHNADKVCRQKKAGHPESLRPQLKKRSTCHHGWS